jgi:hypothetical protein
LLMPVTDDYVKTLEPIYRDILAAFPRFDATRKAGHGLSYQSLYSALDGQYTLGEIRLACEKMAEGGAMEIKHEIFAQPTDLGEELIAAVTGGSAPPPAVPPVPHNHVILPRSAWGPLVHRGRFYPPGRVDGGAVNWAVQQILGFVGQEERRGVSLAVQIQYDPGFQPLLAAEPNLLRTIMCADPLPAP